MGNISERQVKTKNGNINLSWLKHQYYSLGRSIQDIADKLNVTTISVRKLLDGLEVKTATKEINGQLKENPTSKPVKNFSKVSIRDWEPTLILGSKKEKPKISSSDRWKPKKNRFTEFPKKEIIEKPKTTESLSIESQLHDKERAVTFSKKRKKKHKITYYTCKFCGLKLPKKANFCIQCGTIIKNNLSI